MKPPHAAPRWSSIRCLQGDVTRQAVDAIVNAANTTLRGGGGVDGAIHAAAGPELLAECIARYPEGCRTGEARLTGGYALPAPHVIHTVGPVWRGGGHGEALSLARAYRSSLDCAAQHGLRRLAFPAISTGVYGYPWKEAADVALRALAAGLGAHPDIEEVRVVLHGDELYELFCAALQAR